MHPLTGMLHLKLGKILLFEENLQLAIQHLRKAYEILKITHGLNSSLFKEEVLPLIRQATIENGGL